MTAQFARPPQRGRSGGGPGAEPHAALLIDFDNVTMGIRSDLTKELKNLLNSDIIKGKVAVQRAYADWRRYPQYIVPLAESSVDLIFAPAYGSAKKNATDIRLAIDAMELVFTRPEIGTIILLSGDSDFSSLVLKLKEYGKYVIGVGIRESASDLLVQNCDEYYSYSALTGLTRAGDEAPAISEDPWELVEMALRQMIENDDVMRSDRLKQVILDMDPGFDEKALGFQKFNKFLAEAANRGIISLRKQENGQFEVGPPSPDGAPGTAAADAEPREARDGREGRGRRGRRGRGRREEGREPRETPEPLADRQLELDADSAEGEAAPGAADAGAPPAAGPPAARRKQAAAEEPAAEVPAAAEAEPAVATDGAEAPAAGDLGRSHQLLRRAMKDLTKKNGPVIRDSDVKRRMLELEPGWDEASVGFSKFSRFLRQAHDAQIITLRKGDNGNYDVLLGDGDVHVEEARGERRGRRDRGRGRDDGERRAGRPVRAETAPSADAPPAAAAAPATESGPPAAAPAPAAAAPTAAGTQAAGAPVQPQGTRAAEPAAAPSPVGFRRGSRGRPAAGGPPPLLEGQTIGRPAGSGQPAKTSAAAEPPQPDASVPEATADDVTPAAQDATSSQTAPATPEEAPRPARSPRKAPRAAAGAAAAPAETGKQGARTVATQAKAAKQPARQAGAGERKPQKAFDPASFGLPTAADAIASYISTEYKGVGPKSVQTLVDAVGPERVFETLETQPDRVRELLGAARGERLLEAWADDIAFRRANRAPTSQSSAKAAASQPRRGRGGSGPARGGRGPAKGPGKAPGKGPAKGGPRRGGRGGGRRGSGSSK